jgi:hypothetical protein
MASGTRAFVTRETAATDRFFSGEGSGRGMYSQSMESRGRRCAVSFAGYSEVGSIVVVKILVGVQPLR